MGNGGKGGRGKGEGGGGGERKGGREDAHIRLFDMVDDYGVSRLNICFIYCCDRRARCGFLCWRKKEERMRARKRGGRRRRRGRGERWGVGRGRG